MKLRLRRSKPAPDIQYHRLIQYNPDVQGVECAAVSRMSGSLRIGSACNQCGHPWCWNIDSQGCNACRANLRLNALEAHREL